MNSAKPRIQRRALHGVLLLDKPIGLSSNDALQKVKWLYRAEKAGHTGTLDPLATGLLPICFGAATKFSQVSLEADKGYLATLRLGQTTVGGDREGEILTERPVNVTGEQLLVACASFLGEIEQIPPMQSALKKDGRALYEYARAGIEVERAPRRVTIHRLDIVSWQPDDLLLTLDVRCSKGTYVRTLAQDLGEMLGCGAHLAALRRTHSGGLEVSQAVTLAQLAEEDADARDARLQRPDMLLADWPALSLPDTEAARFLTGLRRRVALPDTPAVRVYGPQGAEGPLPRFLGPDFSAAFLGSGHILAGELIADRLLSPVEVQALLVS